MSFPTTSRIVYAPSHHSFFDDLVTMVFSLFTHTYTTTAFHILNLAGIPGQQRPAEQILTDIRRPIQFSGFYMALDTNSSDDTFVIETLWLQTTINAGSWPQFMELSRVAKSDVPTGHVIGGRNTSHFYRQIVASAFVNYFESQVPYIESKYGTDKRTWTGVVNFARIIRNGFAHGGQLDIRNTSAPPETWRAWTFGPSDSGQNFFMTQNGLGIGEIILLFEELHKVLH